MKSRKKRAHTTPPTQPLKVVAIMLTEREQHLMDRLAGDLTDTLGRGVSRSATLRALVRVAARQPASWLSDQVASDIEQEIPAHRWGKKPVQA